MGLNPTSIPSGGEMRTKLIKALLRGRKGQMATARRLKEVEGGAVRGFRVREGQFYRGGHTATQLKKKAVERARALNKKLVKAKK